MDINFRKITEIDYHKCADVLADAYKGEPWNNKWTHDEALLRIRATMSGFNARGYVVEVDGEVIAQCLGRVDYYNDGWKQFCIDEFNLHSNFQGQGIGSNFMNYVINELEQENIDRIWLLTGGYMAAKFYEKNGFEESSDGTMMTLELQA